MSDSNLPAPRSSDEITFDARSVSPLMQRGVDRLNTLSIHNISDSTCAASPRLMWSYIPDLDPEDESQYIAHSTLIGNKLISEIGGCIAVRDIDKGTDEWTTSDYNYSLYLSQEISGNGRSSICLTSDRGIELLDIETGTEVWLYPKIYGERVGCSGIVLGINAVYACYEYKNEHGRSCAIVALDPTSGNEIWRRDYLGMALASHNLVSIGWNTFAILGRVVSDLFHHPNLNEPLLIALDGTSGDTLWSLPLGSQSPFNLHRTLLCTNTSILADFDENRIAAVDIYTGEIRWLHTGQLEGVHKSSLLIWEESGLIRALDGETGLTIWTFSSGTHNHLDIVSDDLAIIESSNGNGTYTLHGVDIRSGDSRWQFADWSHKGRGDGWKLMTVSGTTLYIWHEYHLLYAVDIESGKKIWSLSPGSAIIGLAAIPNGVLITTPSHALGLQPRKDHDQDAVAYHPSLWEFQVSNNSDSQVGPPQGELVRLK